MFGLGKKNNNAKSSKTAERILKNSEQVVHRVIANQAETRKQDLIFAANYPIWQKGEEARKAGDPLKAIAYYEEAKRNGYAVPALFKSYAMAYRKIGDVQKEISIIEEGITILSNITYGDMSTGLKDLKDRLIKARALLNKTKGKI